MIYVLYGGDEFSRDETLRAMKQAVMPPELRDVNISTLNATRTGLDQLLAVSTTIPFMAEKRLVIVEGLLSLFEPRTRSRARAAEASTKAGLGEWEGLGDSLAALPQTTDLVFLEGVLSGGNPLLARIRPLAKTTTFPLPTGRELRRWIRERAAKRGVAMEADAIDGMAEAVGTNLRVIDSELQKLALYRDGEVVRLEDVQEVVAYVREASIFAAVDAVVEGRPGTALRLTHQLLDSGRTATSIVATVGRQIRLLLLAKDLRSQGVSPSDMAGRLSISGYPLRKTLEQERRLTAAKLVWMHRRLLDADLSMKTTATDDQLVLGMLIAELASESSEGRPGTRTL